MTLKEQASRIDAARIRDRALTARVMTALLAYRRASRASGKADPARWRAVTDLIDPVLEAENDIGPHFDAMVPGGKVGAKR